MKLVERIFLLAGAVLFVWLLHRIGLRPIAENLGRIGWGFLILFAFQGAVLILDTLGWRFTLPPGSRADPFEGMFGMRLAGDAINYLTPTAAMGGELVRYRLLSRTHPPPAAVASVALLVINQFFSQVLFILAGAPFFYFALGHRAVQWSGALVSLAVLLTLLLAGLIYLGRSGGGLQRMRKVLHRFVPARALARTPPPAPRGRVLRTGTERPRASNRGDGSPRLPSPDAGEGRPKGPGEAGLERDGVSRGEVDADPWQQVDDNVFGAYRKRPADMVLSIFCFVLGWSVGIGECAVILFFLGVHAAWTTIVAIEALSVLVETALFFVPGKIGTQEGGKYFIFLSLGLNPAAGFSFGLTRRVRELAWALTGLVVLAVMQRGDGTRREPSSRN